MKPDDQTELHIPQGGRVLIVDDDRKLQRLIAGILTPMSYEVTKAGSVRDAGAALRSHDFDVVLLDLELPDGSGFEVLDAITNGDLNAVPIVLTGTQDISSAVSAMMRGATDYLAKPPSLKDLRRVVERASREAHARRRERTLESLVADWAATFDACPDYMLVLDAEYRILKSNHAVEGLVCCETGELQGRPVGEILPRELANAVLAVEADGQPVKVIDRGSERHYVLTLSAIKHGLTIAIIRDATDLVRAEAAQARLYRKLLTAQEEERGRIARELHDGIAQSIVSLSLGLRAVADRVTDSDAKRLGAMAETACRVLEEIRGLARGLRPRVIDDHGLVAALERLGAEFELQSGVKVDFHSSAGAERRIPAVLELNVYRIVQEALANVAKHAGATTVGIDLIFNDHTVEATIRDDGRGGARDRGSSMGLADMRERTELLGGKFRLLSEPGRGTTIGVAIPNRVTVA